MAQIIITVVQEPESIVAHLLYRSGFDAQPRRRNFLKLFNTNWLHFDLILLSDVEVQFLLKSYLEGILHHLDRLFEQPPIVFLDLVKVALSQGRQIIPLEIR